MNEALNNEGGSLPAEAGNSTGSGLDRRIFRAMTITVMLAVIASLPFAQWRVSSGLLLGGILSLLNHYWLSSSTAAAFTVLVYGAKPRMKLAQYVLRYLFIAIVVFVAYKFNLVSLPATIVGLCSFVVALFAEALREFYLQLSIERK